MGKMNKSRKKKKESNLLAMTTSKRRLRRPFPNPGGFSAWRVGADTVKCWSLEGETLESLAWVREERCRFVGVGLRREESSRWQ